MKSFDMTGKMIPKRQYLRQLCKLYVEQIMVILENYVQNIPKMLYKIVPPYDIISSTVLVKNVSKYFAPFIFE